MKLPIKLRARLRQRAFAVLDADAETEGFADDVATVLGCDDVPPDSMQAAQQYYMTLAKRMN